jgi:DNA invertase Pin-like site-specific DNA recombinase
MATGKFISYCRVSTAKQGSSGLGLEAQRETIRQYLEGGDWQLIGEFVEVESGKNNDRPELARALKECRLTGATLLVAKLDRLSRDIHFITSLEKAGIEFVVCDFPTANRFTIHIFAALAQYERELISQRTKAALAAKKARGVELGKPENLTKEAADQGRVQGRTVIQNNADRFASRLAPKIKEYGEQGITSLNGIAFRLNQDHVLTARGKAGTWTPTAVRNLRARILKIDAHTRNYRVDTGQGV